MALCFIEGILRRCKHGIWIVDDDLVVEIEILRDGAGLAYGAFSFGVYLCERFAGLAKADICIRFIVGFYAWRVYVLADAEGVITFDGSEDIAHASGDRDMLRDGGFNGADDLVVSLQARHCGVVAGGFDQATIMVVPFEKIYVPVASHR